MTRTVRFMTFVKYPKRTGLRCRTQGRRSNYVENSFASCSDHDTRNNHFERIRVHFSQNDAG